ncbi:hypothetical protein [Litchfieldia alkalitelluris]|uniref:hypothetical protein n=1 Tax=Litchfieldia alkalitelluris TaxID=304268 RepID=UPI0009967F2A|nr:hypothetical protein [Litchfieldia alkalitelluris]
MNNHHFCGCHNHQVRRKHSFNNCHCQSHQPVNDHETCFEQFRPLTPVLGSLGISLRELIGERAIFEVCCGHIEEKFLATIVDVGKDFVEVEIIKLFKKAPKNPKCEEKQFMKKTITRFIPFHSIKWIEVKEKTFFEKDPTKYDEDLYRPVDLDHEEY